MVWAIFVLCALVIVWAGSKLSRYGDIIAERTGLGGAVIGIALLATVTSLPELVTSVSSILFVRSPDLAVGALYGSNCFNLAIIALLDILYRQGPLLNRVHPSHLLSAGLGTAYIGTTVALILFYQQGHVVELLGVGLSSPIFVGTYILSIALIFRFERRRRAQVLDALVEDEAPAGGMGVIYLKTALVAGVIIAAGIVLASTGDQIAESTGWGRSFVGSLFLAIATSLPELVVSVSALRIGAVDMAVSNVLGSNLFNMVILAACDLMYRQGPLLAAVSPAAVMPGLTSIVMTGVVIAGLMYRTQSNSVARVGAETGILTVVYLAGSYFLFVMSSV